MRFLNKVRAKYSVAAGQEATAYDGHAAGFGDIKGIKPGDKDLGRIQDIMDKANGDPAKIMQLIRAMAKSVTKLDKAQRRAAAALKLLPKKLGQEAAQEFLAKF